LLIVVFLAKLLRRKMKYHVVHAKNLSKRFDSLPVLDDVSLEIAQGDVFCLLGPNGSGKTTLINCILALLKPENGAISIFGNCDLVQAKKRMGVVMEEDGFYRDMNVMKNMQIVCLIKNASFDEIPILLKKLSLWDQRKKMVKKLSEGMRKRLAIACSMVGNPDFLIWDEPYNGLDPTGFQFMRTLISELREQGKTILISTHLLDEVKKTATKTALMHNGKVQEVLEVKEISEKYGSMDKFYMHHVPELF
jgi:ABC-2 type transport system ATP-binding protein